MKLFSIIFSLFVGTTYCFQLPNKNIKPVMQTHSKLNKVQSETKLNVHALNGFDIGIPINIFHNLFTNIHYGYDITNVKTTLLLFAIGYYTYGKDRYKDALEYEERPFETNKKELYDYILKNKSFYSDSYDIAAAVIFITLLFDKQNYVNNIPFLLFLATSEYYKDIKRNYGLFKSFYVSVMWTFACVVLPCVLHDHNYDILNYPMDYIPCLLTIFATSNLNDIKDIEEDKINGITTLPVAFGRTNTNMLVLVCLALSSLIFGMNEHYLDRPLINSFFELQNIGFSVIPYIIEENSKKK